MDKITIDRDNFIQKTVDALHSTPMENILEEFPNVFLLLGIYAACIATELFEEEEKPEKKPEQKPEDDEAFMPKFVDIYDVQVNELRYYIMKDTTESNFRVLVYSNGMHVHSSIKLRSKEDALIYIIKKIKQNVSC